MEGVRGRKPHSWAAFLKLKKGKKNKEANQFNSSSVSHNEATQEDTIYQVTV